MTSIQNRLKVEKQNINQQNEEIQQIVEQKDTLQNEISTLKFKILKEEGEQKKLKDEYENAEKTVPIERHTIEFTFWRPFQTCIF